MMTKSIELYGDGIGRVEYVEHMGSDLTIVNSARVSFGVHKEELDERDIKLIKYLIKHKHSGAQLYYLQVQGASVYQEPAPPTQDLEL
jgi:hypothetical protein